MKQVNREFSQWVLDELKPKRITMREKKYIYFEYEKWNLPVHIDLLLIDKRVMQMIKLKTRKSKEQVHLNFLNQVHRKENKIYKMHNSKIYP